MSSALEHIKHIRNEIFWLNRICQDIVISTSRKYIQTNIYLLKKTERARKDSSPSPELKLANITPIKQQSHTLFRRKKNKWF